MLLCIALSAACWKIGRTSTTTSVLAQLGLDKEDIEELIFHLEDELGLTAFTAEEDRMLKTARTANDLSRFLVKIGRD